MKRNLAVLSLLFASALPQLAAADDRIIAAIRDIERRLDARVGFALHDTGSGKRWFHRADERFPMASTFKVLACGALLANVDAGSEDSSRRVTIAASDLVPHAPVTQGHVGSALSLRELCEATMRTSDNAAANKILDALGGPGAVTRFVRSLGDMTTRLDRREIALNEGTPGDPRDTTSPAAMVATLEWLVLGGALSASSRDQLTQWLLTNAVGGPLLRAGLPADWRVADRTGAGGHGTRGVVAVIWPPGRAPLVAVVYITGTHASMDARNTAIADVGRAIAEAWSRSR
jgi:beta-lactamase class A